MKQIYIYVIVAIIAGAVAGFTGYQTGYSKGYEVSRIEADKAVKEIRDLLVTERDKRQQQRDAWKKHIEEMETKSGTISIKPNIR